MRVIFLHKTSLDLSGFFWGVVLHVTYTPEKLPAASPKNHPIEIQNIIWTINLPRL